MFPNDQYRPQHTVNGGYTSGGSGPPSNQPPPPYSSPGPPQMIMNYQPQYAQSGAPQMMPNGSIMMPMQGTAGPGGGSQMMMVNPNASAMSPAMSPPSQQQPIAGFSPPPNNGFMGQPRVSVIGTGSVGDSGAVGSGGGRGDASNPEQRRRLIQHQLVLLLHAFKCRSSNAEGNCTVMHCDTMKRVLDHMNSCQEGRRCAYAHCASSRQIINHWRSCERRDCPVCSSLRERNGTAATGGPQAAPSGDGMAFGEQTPIQLGSNPPTNTSPYPNIPSTSADTPTRPSDIPLTNPNLRSTPLAPTTEHEWHGEVLDQLRQFLIAKIVRAVFPDMDQNAMYHEKTAKVYEYAQRTEKDLYEKSKSRDEYYLMLAERIYKIQKDREEKKEQKNRQEIARANPGIGSGSASFDPSISGLGTPNSAAMTPNDSQRLSTSQEVFKQELSQEIKLQFGTGLPNDVTKKEPIIKEEPRIMPQPSSTDDIPMVKEEKKESPVKRFIIQPEKIRRQLMPSLEKLFRTHPDSQYFRDKVNAADAPDYYSIIKHPMDLSKIKNKLDTGEYRDPWEYCDDVWLMFENAWLYNKRNSRVYKASQKLASVFETEIDPVMQQMGYCCGRLYTYNPMVLCCMGQPLCQINRDALYFHVNEKYMLCEKCFGEAKDEVELNEIADESNAAAEFEQSSPRKIKFQKSQFREGKNSKIQKEDFVHCKCGRKWHEVCAMYLKQITPVFECRDCAEKSGRRRKENKYTAKNLPVNKLSEFMEDKCNKIVRTSSDSGHIYIRVLSFTEKSIEVKDWMRKYFPDMPERFPYKSKAIFVFQEIEGADVMFFGMHVQEYDSNCTEPNNRRVYISYLDSVKFFSPAELRTTLYHEILKSYMLYCKSLGYAYAHIWACPPSEGDDYIFHSHPVEQKIPKAKGLQKWYKTMQDQATLDGIIKEYRDIYKDCTEYGYKPLSDIPYFEGDYWSNTLEELIKEFDEEEQKRRDEEECGVVGVGDVEIVGGGFLDDDEDSCELPMKRKFPPASTQKKNKKSKMKKNSGNLKKNGEQDLQTKVYTTMEKVKESFFTIRLYHPSEVSSLPPIQDPDQLITCELMDGRDQFLSLCRENHYEFSTLRRAKHTTMAVLYNLHVQGRAYNCNMCGLAVVSMRYHCNICEDFDLCAMCQKKETHEHKLELIGVDPEDKDSGAAGGNQSNKKPDMPTYIAYLEHASQCRNANCPDSMCQKFKRFIQHMHQCKKMQHAQCETCKKLIAIAYYHAKKCHCNTCQVPFCNHLRSRWKQQQARERNFLDARCQTMHRLMQQNSGGESSSQQNSSSSASTPSSAAKGGGGKRESSNGGGGGPTNAAHKAVEQAARISQNQIKSPPPTTASSAAASGGEQPEASPTITTTGSNGGGLATGANGGGAMGVNGSGGVDSHGQMQIRLVEWIRFLRKDANKMEEARQLIRSRPGLQDLIRHAISTGQTGGNGGIRMPSHQHVSYMTQQPQNVQIMQQWQQQRPGSPNSQQILLRQQQQMQQQQRLFATQQQMPFSPPPVSSVSTSLPSTTSTASSSQPPPPEYQPPASQQQL